jgi:hypothetical protein
VQRVEFPFVEIRFVSDPTLLRLELPKFAKVTWPLKFY